MDRILKRETKDTYLMYMLHVDFTRSYFTLLTVCNTGIKLIIQSSLVTPAVCIRKQYLNLAYPGSLCSS
jgi:retron-type reverse transcriptase